MMATKVTTLETKVRALEKKIESIERKLDYLISLVEKDEDFAPEEIEELDELADRIERGEVKTYPAEEVFRRLGFDTS